MSRFFLHDGAHLIIGFKWTLLHRHSPPIGRVQTPNSAKTETQTNKQKMPFFRSTVNPFLQTRVYRCDGAKSSLSLNNVFAVWVQRSTTGTGNPEVGGLKEKLE